MAEAGYRFYVLYDKIYREDILTFAYAVCRSNQGAPGIAGADIGCGANMCKSMGNGASYSAH